MLTPYDEFPVHQSPYPFSCVPSTDYNWDDGYYVGAFCPEEKLFLATGLRVNPNSDMIGGYSILNVAGLQYTVRFNRCWRPCFDLRVGPYAIEFIEPLRKFRFRLDEHGSDLSFDLVWEGVSPAYLEHHHLALNRGRRTTDQSRYSQPGKVTGTVKFRGRTYQASPETWSGSRDHSWGLYAERPPLGPLATLLPPKQLAGKRRAMRFWTCFRSEPFSGFFHVHETSEGEQCEMADVFGGPFEGRIYRGWSSEPVVLETIKHRFEYEPGTRILRRADFDFIDAHGESWHQEYIVASPPWLVVGMGYTPGSWKDGGTFHTFHGSEELALEWDEFDFSRQPVRYIPYKVSGAAAKDNYGIGIDYDKPIQGVEYLARVTTTAPDGSVGLGSCQIEHFVNGRYSPYGFEDFS
jgi:hypothetical protein